MTHDEYIGVTPVNILDISPLLVGFSLNHSADLAGGQQKVYSRNQLFQKHVRPIIGPTVVFFNLNYDRKLNRICTRALARAHIHTY